MRRREFAAVICGIVLWPSARGAAQPRARKLRIAIATAQPRTASFWTAFDRRLRELDYVDGENLTNHFRFVRRLEGYSTAMSELVGLSPDILVATGPEAALKAAVEAGPTLPIVMIAADYDPIALGYARSLAKPGGNVTGVVFQQIELAVKRAQLFKEALPGLSAASVLWDAASADQWQEIRHARAELGLRIADIGLREQPHDYGAALASLATEHRRALLVCMSPIFFRDREAIVAAAQRHQTATMFGLREFVEAGGLLSYGASLSGLYRRAADYIVRIAQGAAPSDLPIEQPTKFELHINLKTAIALGLTIPPTLLARADEVIE